MAKTVWGVIIIIASIVLLILSSPPYISDKRTMSTADDIVVLIVIVGSWVLYSWYLASQGVKPKTVHLPETTNMININKSADRKYSTKRKKFCQSCGMEITNTAAEICTKCGVRLAGGEGKDWLVTLLLSIFVGGLGIHRFYTGHTGTAIAILFLSLLGSLTFIFYIGAPMLLIVGVWVLVDIIRMAIGSFTDVNGNVLIKR